MLSNPNLSIFVVKGIISCLQNYYVSATRSKRITGVQGEWLTLAKHQCLNTISNVCALAGSTWEYHGAELGPNTGYKWKSH